jgi:PAS domain S-box-containing protein
LTGPVSRARWWWSIQAYLALFAATLILPILVFAGFLLWQYGEGERARLESAALEEARDIAQAVDGELGNVLSSAQILALMPAVRNGRFEDFYQLAQDVQRTLGIISVLRSPDGQQLVNPLAPPGPSLPKMELPSDRAALTTKRSQVSDLFTGGVSQLPLFTVTVPVMRDNGEVNYLLNHSFPVERLRGIIARQQPPANWVVAIVDRSGAIMARNVRHEEFVGKPATRDLQENTQGREGTWNGFTADGRAVLGAYSRSQMSEWRIAIGIQRAELTAPLRRSLVWLSLLGAGLLALSGLLAWLFGQRIAAPIQALADRAIAVGHGETVAPVRTNLGEIRHVGEALAIASAELREREAAIRESKEHLRLAVDAGRMAVWNFDVQADRLIGSPELYQLFGFPPEATPSMEEFRARYYPGERERIWAEIRRAVEKGEHYIEIEARYVWPDGQHRWLLVRGAIHLGADRAPSRLFGVVFDITERKRWEEHLQLLIHELNHRVKNTLATVQSIAFQTLRSATTAEEAREAMEARLFALSRAHNVLTKENWEGAELGEIVAQAMEPYEGYGTDRLHWRGPQVRLSPRMALALAMALQELATNAVKYGALSNTTGEIRIVWNVDANTSPARLHLQWEETGGPPVEVPTRRGFGTRLIERSLAHELDGDVRINFARAGVTCTVDAPLA